MILGLFTSHTAQLPHSGNLMLQRNKGWVQTTTKKQQQKLAITGKISQSHKIRD
jgi:hypothetical protein